MEQNTTFPEIGNDSESLEIINLIAPKFLEYFLSHQKVLATDLITLSTKGNKKAGDIILYLLKNNQSPQEVIDIERKLFFKDVVNRKDVDAGHLKWSEFEITESGDKKFVTFECELLFFEETASYTIEQRYLATTVYSLLTKEIIKPILILWLKEKQLKLRQLNAEKNKGHYFATTSGTQIIKGRPHPEHKRVSLIKQVKCKYSYEILPTN